MCVCVCIHGRVIYLSIYLYIYTVGGHIYIYIYIYIYNGNSRIVLDGKVVFPKDKASATKPRAFTDVDAEPQGVARRNQDLPDARSRRAQRSASPAHILKS